MHDSNTVAGALPQNVNYAIKISYALPLLESVGDRKFEDAVREVRDATVLVLVF